MINRLSSLKRFLPATRPRNIVILSDALFFVRAVPIAEGAAAAEVTEQVSLALESSSPFPLNQLYHGHYWQPGAAHALVFAAYRKRFTGDDVATWAGAEIVLPAFATLLKDAPAAATTVLVNGADSFTAIHYGDASGVPTQVRTEVLPVEATPAERASVRDALLRSFGGSKKTVEIDETPHFDIESPQGEFVFRAGSTTVQLDAGGIESRDVRDKVELAARRRAHRRDIILWRTFLVSAAAIVLAFVLELVLVGSTFWQNGRLEQIARQQPIVDAIMTSQTLGTRIDQLSSQRLMPFEMLAVVNSKRPPSVQFLRVATTGLHTIEISAQTAASQDIDLYRAALNSLPQCSDAEVLDPRSRDGLSTFRLVVTFKPDAFTQEATQP